MAKMSVGEFETNPKQAVAMIEAGVAVELTRDGRVVANIVPTAAPVSTDRQAALARLHAALETGIPFGRKFTYEERTT